MTDGASDDGIFPVVVVKVNGVMCRALKDPGDRSSYGSANLVHNISVLLTSDIEKAFLQVRIKAEERDSLRFMWQSPGSDDVTVYRFTRALFGLTCSPFLSGGVINEHLKIWETKYPEMVKEIRDNLYVDDLITGGESVQSVETKRSKAVEVFDDAKFNLRKWHSNDSSLEIHDPSSQSEEDLTYAKQQLGSHECETKISGLL